MYYYLMPEEELMLKIDFLLFDHLKIKYLLDNIIKMYSYYMQTQYSIRI